MTYKEFWEEDPDIFWAYHFYFYRKQEIDTERINFTAWLNGLYIYNAVSTAVSNSFRAKGSKANDYIGQPIDLQLNKKQETKKKTQDELSDLDLKIKDRAMQIKKMLEKKRLVK